MSFLTNIENAEHTALNWVTTELTKLRGIAPSLAEGADVLLTYAAPVLETIESASGNPAAATITAAVVSEAQRDLAVASSLVTDIGATPSVSSLYSSVAQNLSGLLTAAHVTDTKSVANVNKIVGEITTFAAAVTAAAPKAPTA